MTVEDEVLSRIFGDQTLFGSRPIDYLSQTQGSEKLNSNLKTKSK